ncbi:hypothetical protein O3M35_006427 [Rhynocoris fuscipes]|uniref:Peptidase S1 domain-containing protein n=1 Tax=Rhynocoris fuscipes TaxID=488301 RepID=A0AAW1DE08_9HEMI
MLVIQLQIMATMLAGSLVLAKQTPMVDPGLFVISGVTTCGGGSGYCLLGSDCSLDQDFIEDTTGHCKGLKGAFTPSAHFVCCRDSKLENEIEPNTNEQLKPNVTLASNDSDTSYEQSTNSAAVKDRRNEIIVEFVGKSLPINLMDTSKSKIDDKQQVITTTEEIIETTVTIADDPVTSASKLAEQTSTDKEAVTNSNATMKTENCSENNCTTSVRFFSEESQICLGMLIGPGWVLTSASCALRIFRVGMVNVFGSPLDDVNLVAAVKTIIVNENYRPSVSNILLPEPNNVGLIKLNDTFNEKCTPCLPDKNSAFAGEICYTFVNTTVSSTKSGKIDIITCEAELETMQGEAKEEFFTISCESPSQSKFLGGEIDSGKGLICQGYLAGVETSSGVGMTVFSKVSTYADWIQQNMKPNIRQHFKLIN